MSRLEHGIVAADHVLGAVLGQRVSKALDPLKPRDFVVIMGRITSRLEGVTKADEARAMAAALDSLDVRWASLGPEAVDKIVKAANKVLLGRVQSIPKKIEGVLSVEGPKFAKNVRASAVRNYKLGIETDLSMRNVEVEKILRRTTINFIRDEMGNRVEVLSERARAIVERGLKSGLGSDQIGANLRAGLNNRVVKSPAYWRTVAGAFTAHSRAFGQIDAFDEASIAEWMFSSVLDEATTPICRLYHGKTWKTSTAVAHMERMTSLADPEEVVNVAPWVRNGTDDDGEFLYVVRNGKNVRIADVVRSGVGSSDDTGKFSKVRSNAQLEKIGVVTPPLHGHCRSTLLPA